MLDVSRRTALLACLAVFLLAGSVRLRNSATAFAGGVPTVRPFDELYHLKRMTYSAAHFPSVLEYDKDRGIEGAFCPWPPLYDLTAGGVARLFGAKTIGEVLSIVVWIPPLVFASFIALFTYVVGWRAPILALVSALAMATSPWLVFMSWIGSIDHHFLEPLFVLLILGAVLAVHRASDMRTEVWAGFSLAMAMTTGIFVQPAILVACGLAFAACFAARRFLATAVAFAIPAAAVAAYRMTRLDGFPDSSWFLGWPYAALFLGATVAALTAWRLRTKTIASMIVALLPGMMTTLIMPGVGSALVNGIGFFGGEPWLASISEFQPLFRLPFNVMLVYLETLSSGVLLVWLLLARAVRRRDSTNATIAAFAIVYLILTVTSLRFATIATPLLAVAGAALAQAWYRDGRRVVAAFASLLIVLPPVIRLLWLDPSSMPQPISRLTSPLQLVGFLQRQNPSHERILSKWYWGHAFDVLGESPVILDNFGVAPDPAGFYRANEILLTADENDLARYCDQAGVGFVILDHPRVGIPNIAHMIGRNSEPYLRQGEPTNALRATWWWRAWEAAPLPTRYFRPVQMSADRELIVWRYMGRAP